MAINLNNDDQKKLDDFIGVILDLYRADDVSKVAAIGAIAHVLTAAALDDEGLVREWLHKPDVLERWKQGIRGAQ